MAGHGHPASNGLPWPATHGAQAQPWLGMVACHGLQPMACRASHGWAWPASQLWHAVATGKGSCVICPNSMTPFYALMGALFLQTASQPAARPASILPRPVSPLPGQPGCHGLPTHPPTFHFSIGFRLNSNPIYQFESPLEEASSSFAHHGSPHRSQPFRGRQGGFFLRLPAV